MGSAGATMTEPDTDTRDPVDVLAVCAGLQSQIDELVRAFRAQQHTIDELRAELSERPPDDDAGGR